MGILEQETVIGKNDLTARVRIKNNTTGIKQDNQVIINKTIKRT